MKIDAQKQAGTFQGDVLVEGLGNPEHPGRTRGVGAFAPWKTGRNWTLENKRECKRARQALYDENLRKKFKDEILAEIRAELVETGALPPVLIDDPRRSSCASRVAATAGTDASYPCDHIKVIKPIDHTKYKLCIFI